MTKALQKELCIDNMYALPRITKVIVNVGMNRSRAEGKEMADHIAAILQRITGQKPAFRPARKSIANFKIRQGMIVGAMVTLRGKRMEVFLDRLLSYALPRIRDFRGLSPSFDGQGNFAMGITEYSVFPEAPPPADIRQLFGLQVQITTTARDDRTAEALLRAMGFPFRRERQKRGK